MKRIVCVAVLALVGCQTGRNCDEACDTGCAPVGVGHASCQVGPMHDAGDAPHALPPGAPYDDAGGWGPSAAPAATDAPATTDAPAPMNAVDPVAKPDDLPELPKPADATPAPPNPFE